MIEEMADLRRRIEAERNHNSQLRRLIYNYMEEVATILIMETPKAEQVRRYNEAKSALETELGRQL